MNHQKFSPHHRHGSMFSRSSIPEKSTSCDSLTLSIRDTDSPERLMDWLGVIKGIGLADSTIFTFDCIPKEKFKPCW